MPLVNFSMRDHQKIYVHDCTMCSYSICGNSDSASCKILYVGWQRRKKGPLNATKNIFYGNHCIFGLLTFPAIIYAISLIVFSLFSQVKFIFQNFGKTREIVAQNIIQGFSLENGSFNYENELLIILKVIFLHDNSKTFSLKLFTIFCLPFMFSAFIIC